MKIQRLTTTGTSTMTVNDALFAAPLNWQLLSQAIRVYQANNRQGTSRVKTRSEVARTKKKWFKQKGTGNARHGARSAPIFVGGGVAHGPSGFQNWSLSLPARMKRQALIVALSAQAENVVVADTILELTGKTKEAAQLLSPIAPSSTRILVILPEFNEQVLKAFSNLSNVEVTTASQVTALQVSSVQQIIFPAETVKRLEMRLLGKQEVVADSKEPVKKVKSRTVTKKALE